MPRQTKPNNENGSMFPIPKNVLDKLNEYTIGGFALFFFDIKTGKPTQIMTFDNPICALAMQKHIEQWVQTLEQVNLNISVGNIMRNLEDGNSSDES